MDRHLKERLVGAAVLLAAANLFIPGMLSGPADDVNPGEIPAAADGAALKTYTIDLTKAAGQTTAVTETTLAPPPEQPEELPRIASTAQSPPVAGATDEPPATTERETVAGRTTADTRTAPTSRQTETKSVQPAEPAASSDTEVLTVPRTAQTAFAVQVASFEARATSERIAGELKARGLPAFVAASEVKGKTMYRVRVGPAESRADAEALLRKVKSSNPGANIVTHP